MLRLEHGHLATLQENPVVTLLPILFAVQAIVSPLHDCVMSKLSAQGLDQEVKECAISCAAAAVSQLGDALQPQLAHILQVCRFALTCIAPPVTSAFAACDPDCLHVILVHGHSLPAWENPKCGLSRSY